MDKAPITKQYLVKDFARLGVQPGGLLMVHSSLRSIGLVEGGAETVVDALLEALSPGGTLVVPTFTFPAANDPDFVFDPQRTPSSMGAISEAARRRAGALRSIHTRHSVAALGPRAEKLASAGTGAAWDGDSPMSLLMQDGGMVMVLGVPYLHVTLFHLYEVEVQVPYRTERTVERGMRMPDGSLAILRSRVYPPNGTELVHDFNRFGVEMERNGRVRVGPVGNAVARLFYGRDARSTALQAYKRDPKAFLQAGTEPTCLSTGHTVRTDKGDLSVYDPVLFDSTPEESNGGGRG